MTDSRARLSAALVGQYRLERELGQGASATVYLAYDLRNGARAVALKALRPELAAAVQAERFQDEIGIVSALNHPNILPLFDWGNADGVPYYVIPYVRGGSLRRRLEARSPLPGPEAVRIVAEMARALDHAHEHGIVHRDVSPENVLLHEGQATVADFGVAAALDRAGGERRTRSGITIGTALYMSPEQATGEHEITVQSDVYALGCVAFELLVGRPPFAGPNQMAILFQHVHVAPPAPSASRHDLRATDAVFARVLAKSPSERYQSAGDFAAALAQTAVGVSAGPASPPAAVRRPVETPARSRPVRDRAPAPRRALRLAVAAPGVTALWRPAARSLVSRAGLVGAAFVVTTTFVPSARSTREPGWLLVSDVSGPPADPMLARVVRDLVTAEVNQSSAVRTLSREQIRGALRAAGRPDTAVLGVDLARELAYRSAVRAVLAGDVMLVGAATRAPRYAVTLRVIDVDSGHELVTASDAAPAEELLPAVQRLARRVRQRFGEHPDMVAASRPALATITPSLPAYRRYVAGITLRERGKIAASTTSLLEAVRLDTAFASAWAALGMNYLDGRVADSARTAIAEALRRPHRLSEASRYRLRGDAAYILDHDLGAAVRWYDLYLNEAPHSVGGRNNRALYLSLLGRYDEAVDEFARAARDNPLGRGWAQMPLLNQVACLVAAGRPEQAREVAAALTGPFATYAAIQFAAARNDWGAADSLAAAPAASADAPGWLRIQAVATRAAARAARGAVRSADALLAHAAGTRAGAEHRWYAQMRVLLALAADAGDDAGRTREFASARPDTTAGGTLMTGLTAASAGDTAVARRALADLHRRPASVVRRLGHGPRALEALIASRSHAWGDVVRLLAPAALEGEHDSTDLDRVTSALLRWIVSDAYARQGRLDSATAYLELAVSARRVPPGHVPLRGLIYPFAERRLARWYAARGDSAASRAHWRAFQTVFSSPDPRFLPLLTEPVPAVPPVSVAGILPKIP